MLPSPSALLPLGEGSLSFCPLGEGAGRCPEPVEGRCPEPVDGRRPEPVEGRCPEPVEGLVDTLPKGLGCKTGCITAILSLHICSSFSKNVLRSTS